MSNPSYIGRLAPSPTGLLHLGNAFAFWMAWLDARKAGGTLILRMEDIDPDRARPEFIDAIRRDLEWLGLDWDIEAPPQSTRKDAYENAIEKLQGKGLVYPCFCSRKELRFVAGAPQVGDAGAPYPGTCRELPRVDREKLAASGRQSSLRLNCALFGNHILDFSDRICGTVRRSLNECGGDFAIKRSDGVIAYQLAVVADDMDQGVTHIIRGEDILSSTPRQLYLYGLLDGTPPLYAHVPLVMDHKNERLAKRHASLSLAALRDEGITPEKVLGAIAWMARLKDVYTPLKAADLLADFNLDRLQGKSLRLTEDIFSCFIRDHKV